MMHGAFISRCAAPAAWLAALLLSGPVYSDAVDDILALTPDDAAACVIIRDLEGHWRTFLESNLRRRIDDLPVVKAWKESGEFRKLHGALTFISIYYGQPFEQIRDKILGQAIVFVFFPHDEDRPDTGIVFFRASDEAMLEKIFDHVSVSFGPRKVVQKQHRNVRYAERIEGERRADYMLRLGPVAVVTDKEWAIQRVIDAHVEGNSLAAREEFRRIQSRLPANSVAQLILDARAFDRYLKNQPADAPPSPERLMRQRIADEWERLDWAALTVDVDQSLRVSLWLGGKGGRFPANHATRKAPQSADVLAWVNVTVPFEQLWTLVQRMAELQPDKDVHVVGRVLHQLLYGFDGVVELAPRFGPGVEFLATASDSPLGFDAVLSVGFRDLESKASPSLQLSAVLEPTLRFALVLIGQDRNQKWREDWVAGLEEMGGRRVHFLRRRSAGVRWLEPAFAIAEGAVVFATRPQAVESYLANPSPVADPQPEAVIAVLMVSQARQWIGQRKTDLVQLLSRNRPEAAPMVAERMEAILSLAALVDRVTLSRRVSDGVLGWTLALHASR